MVDELDPGSYNVTVDAASINAEGLSSEAQLVTTGGRVGAALEIVPEGP